MSTTIEVNGLSRTFGSVKAVDNVSFTIEGPGIHGLLGRNGAGKTTLMHVLTGQDFATSGTATIDGEPTVENAALLRRVCFIKESQAYPDGFKGRHVLACAPMFYDNWDAEYAQQLVKDFGVPLDRYMKKLSRGQRSMIGVIVGLASRADITFFDEPYAGLDAVSRHKFYDHLLQDFAMYPRTVVLSTHLIDEAADLLERVIVIDEGRILIDSDAEDLRGAAATVVGSSAAVGTFVDGRDVLAWNSLGSLAQVTVDRLTQADRDEAVQAGLELLPVSLQQLIVRRTGADSHKEAAA